MIYKNSESSPLSFLLTTTMPLLSNTFQATQYLKDVQDWSLNPIKSFTPIQALINAGVTVEQQRMLHFLDFLERMSIAGCDNTDPGKTHPAYIKDDDLRNEVDQVTKKMLLDLVRTVKLSDYHPTPSQIIPRSYFARGFLIPDVLWSMSNLVITRNRVPSESRHCWQKTSSIAPLHNFNTAKISRVLSISFKACCLRCWLIILVTSIVG